MITKSQINLIRSLKDKNSRTEAQLFVCEGEKMSQEILNSNFSVKYIFCVQNSLSDEMRRFIDGISHVTVEMVTNSEMERLSHLKTPTSILLAVELPCWNINFDDINDKLSLALDGVQDPGNLGTIIRIADWFGITDIFCSQQTVDMFNPKVIQATMGAVCRVRVHYLDLSEFLSEMKRALVPVYGTFLEGNNIYSCDLSQKGVIVMGNEGKGVSKEVAELVTDKLFIPPFPQGVSTSESLNVGVATAIVCSEFRRLK